jgi:hypothetical protein
LETQQHSQNQEKIDKLLLENVELKKNLEKEQLLHTMLYKEWKELNERMLAKEHEVHEGKPKNLFYKYAFYLLLISVFPAYYFINAGKENGKVSSSQTTSVPAPITPIKDSTPITNSTQTTNNKLTANGNTTQQPAVEQPVIKPKEKEKIQQIPQPTLTQPVEKSEEKRKIQQTPQPTLAQPVAKPEEKEKIRPDSSKSKMVTINKPVVESPLTDSIRDLIYWQGWNAYYDRSRNHFKQSSERYNVWLQGWNDGKSDAKKLLAKDSLQKRK